MNLKRESWASFRKAELPTGIWIRVCGNPPVSLWTPGGGGSTLELQKPEPQREDRTAHEGGEKYQQGTLARDRQKRRNRSAEPAEPHEEKAGKIKTSLFNSEH